jgi:hypothetical protein
MMREDTYVAGQIERALHANPRTHELGIRVEVDGDDDVVLRGRVASDERRRFVTQVANEQASGLTLRNEVSVTELLPPEVPEVVPLPEETMPARQVPPPHQASS